MSLAHANLYDFFDERLADAVDAQGVELSTDSRRYLALLLVECKRSERLLTATDRPDTLAELHLVAATADRVRAMRLYRHLGDRALYVAGYFQESLKRKAVGVDYYADMGGAAYQQVATLGGTISVGEDPWAHMFMELAEHFRGCIEVLAEVSERNLADGTQDIVALYERFLESRSEVIARRLTELGVLTGLAGEDYSH